MSEPNPPRPRAGFDLRRFLPSPQSIHGNRWLRWIGPALHHPRLWRFSRRGLALGVALGLFFGLLVPVAQIPLSAGAAVLLRANLPAAVACTLVTNPVTFGPVYYGAWQLGRVVLREPAEAGPPPLAAADAPAEGNWWQRTLQQVGGVGKPLLVGLALVACAAGLLAYFAVSWAWVLRVGWQRRRRRRAALVRRG